MRTTPLLAVLALTAACAEPTPPSRAGTYSFADTIPPDTILLFHWPADRIPVRFYAQPSGNLPFLTERAIGVWAGMFLYDEFAGQLVSDSATADVIVLADSAPDVPPDTGPPVFACTGQTDGPPYTAPIHVALQVLPASPPYSPGQVAACLRRTAIHEIGHALGLLQHSPNAGDIMHGPPVVDLPSEQDRRTAERLYHTPATVLPPP